MTRTVTSASVSVTTNRKAPVRRPWNVRGRSRRNRPGMRARRSTGRSALGEGVPDTPHRQDEHRRRRVVLDLVPQVADVDVYRLLVLVEGLVVAQELEQLRAGVDPPGSRGEVSEDLEFGRRQAHPPVAALDAPPLEIDEQVSVSDDAATDRVREVAIRAPEERLDPAHQLAQTERLRQVVVGTELEADHLVDLVITRGQDEDRHLGAGRPQAAEDLEAVHPRQADVEDDEIGRLACRDVEALLPGTGDGDLVALLLEGVLDATRDGMLVFDDEDGGCHAGMLHRQRRISAGSGHMVVATTRGTLADAIRAPRHSGPPASAARRPRHRIREVPTTWPPPERRLPPNIVS